MTCQTWFVRSMSRCLSVVRLPWSLAPRHARANKAHKPPPLETLFHKKFLQTALGPFVKEELRSRVRANCLRLRAPDRMLCQEKTNRLISQRMGSCGWVRLVNGWTAIKHQVVHVEHSRQNFVLLFRASRSHQKQSLSTGCTSGCGALRDLSA